MASFASGHSEDDEDDNGRLTTEGSQAEEAPPQRAGGPNAFVDGVLKQKATLTSVGGPPRLASQKKCQRKGPLQVR